MNFFKNHAFAIIYAIIVILFSVFVILDALVIEKNVIEVQSNSFSQEEYENSKKIIEDDRYEDENILITIQNDRKYDSTIYLIDIKLNDAKYLKTAFAENKYGRNISQSTSEIAKNCNAILAVNGDFYGFRDYGFVLRNGITYRDTARPKGRDDALIIYDDGNLKMINERNTTIDKEISTAKNQGKSISQIFTFGPKLIDNGEIVENEVNYMEDGTSDEGTNPRTAIGIISPLHYIFVCVDGRSEESRGLKISELKQYMLEKKCQIAYNLDGGSSTTLYFNGKILNKPSAGIERGVSDIVYIGY